MCVLVHVLIYDLRISKIKAGNREFFYNNNNNNNNNDNSTHHYINKRQLNDSKMSLLPIILKGKIGSDG